jgi:hypothetical protein
MGSQICVHRQLKAGETTRTRPAAVGHGVGSAFTRRRRSGVGPATGRGKGCAARRPGAPGGAGSARRSTEAANRGQRRRARRAGTPAATQGREEAAGRLR